MVIMTKGIDMDDKEKGLPLPVELYRQWRKETRDYFTYNGIYGGCFWLLLWTLGILFMVFVVWAIVNGLPQADINNAPLYVPPM